MIKSQVLDACRHLLAPIARLLLRNGVTWGEFAELAKEVLVDVAQRDYGVQGRPTNAARVALMTGLSRREVARVKSILLGEQDPEPAAQSRIAHVLSGWHLDAEFVDADGSPGILAANGPDRSLESLLRRYAGDLPHGAFVKELEQLGLIVPVSGGYRVTARDYVRSAGDPDIVRQAGVALHDHAATLVHNADANRTQPARFEGMATNVSLSARNARAFQEYLAQQGQTFLEAMDSWLAEHALKPSADGRPTNAAGRTVRAGVGVYAIYDDARKGRYDD